ncbi:MAG: tRNA pseudouridine(55) synthase TruB [Spirochaetia bacterium]|nr:tRNA pseudouridine(55) synthase TruB [Spirochaetia bacterium]
MIYDKNLWRQYIPDNVSSNIPVENSGVLMIDKPQGLSSMDVLRILKKIGQIKKAGHAGTLDPLATGVLPVLIHSATKFSERFMEGSKEYEGSVLFGQPYDTQDITGKPLAEKQNPGALTLDQLNGLAQTLTGKIMQTPPIFSAIKKNGRPLYQYARKSRVVDISSREVVVNQFEITEITSEDRAMFYVHCEKGVYVRTLLNDLGNLLGCGAAMESLRRIRVGKFHIDNSIKMEDVKSSDDILEHLVDPAMFL